MNIVFENGRTEREMVHGSRSSSSGDGSRAVSTGKTSNIFAADTIGTVWNQNAYEEKQTKNAADIMKEAGQVDVAAQKNYLAVMSNTMSDEDFAKLQRDGHHPGSTEIETVVTIVDEIKAALAKGGNHITGYTDDLDVETLSQITGSRAMAEEIIRQFEKYDLPVTEENAEDVKKAFEKAQQLQSPNDGMIKYMIENHMEPTIDHLYCAQYSASADTQRQGRGYYQDSQGYYAKKADQFHWDQLQPQMEKVIKNAGLTVSGETLSDAKWLVEQGIPLTEESMGSLHALRNLELPETMEQVAAAAAASIADGKKAGNANVADPESALEKALDYIKDVSEITDEAVDRVAAEGNRLNLRNLKAAQIQISMSVTTTQSYAVSLEGRRVMEEVRLQMTVEANIRLIRSGFSVDTAELEQLVESLKAAQKQAEEALFGNNKEAVPEGAGAIYKNTLSTVNALGSMPAALIGRFTYYQKTEITLAAAYKEGDALRTAYEKAGESYEQLMTAPRKDLGDSIRKAFRNIDDILGSMDMDTSEENRRAVRILSYNQMEISEENLSSVKTMDLSLQRVLHKMTPAAAMEMIREGWNPLTMSLEELEDYLDRQNSSPEREFEKYSEYLYKLEKNQSVTEQERDAYIGLYRLFRQLEKTDGAAIGTLIHQGMEPTVRNLLSAIRSNKKHGMDVSIHDQFGGVTSSYLGKSISEQLSAVSGKEEGYHKKKAAEIFDRLDGGKMGAIAFDPDMSLEELAAALREAEQDQEAEQSYGRQQAEAFRESVKAEDFVIRELLTFDQPVTADHLQAAGLLMKDRGKMAGRMYELAAESEQQDSMEEAMDQILDHMTDKESMQEAYDHLENTYTQILERTAYERTPGEKIDLKEMSSLFKQVALSRNMAREENYEIPVRIGGEITSVNLKIVHDQSESGKVSISMDSEKYGSTSAQFILSTGADGQHHLSGYVICSSREGQDLFKESEERLRESLQKADINIASLHTIFKADLNINSISMTTESRNRMLQTGEEKRQVSTKKLYDTAKIFLEYL